MDAELFTEACEAYERYCRRTGSIYDCPSQYASEIDGGRIYLRNVRGVLARYNINSKRLSWSKADADRQ